MYFMYMLTNAGGYEIYYYELKREIVMPTKN